MINNEELIVNTVIDFKVMVRCLTFNHASYITEAMNGFCMQQTSFPFVCTIVDDASMDGEQDVIRDYLNKHFDLNDPVISRNEETDDYMMIFARHKTNQHCYFAIYLLKYNHRSIKKAKALYLKKWTEQVKYIALCEGDDYWTDSLKLQKQVDYLEGHPGCTMVCNRSKIYSERYKTFVGEKYWYNQNKILKTKEIIRRGGGSIQTASVIYRKDITSIYPDYCLKCATGDHPLQLLAAMKGYIYYMNDIMSVYRIDNSSSWIGSQNRKVANLQRLKTLQTITDMLSGFAKDYPKYRKSLYNRRAMYILNEMPNRFENYEAMLATIKFFAKEISDFSIWWKIDLFLRTTRIPVLNRYYYKSKYIYNGYRAKFLKI